MSTSTLAAHRAAPNAAERLLCPSCAKRSDSGEVTLRSLLLQGTAAEAEEEAEEAKAWYEVAEDFIACPYDAFFKWTHPDPESRKWWPLTLLLSLAWVALLSFVISTIITRWVTVSGVPASFLGLILVSVGAEIPDTIASVTVAKRGYGSLATSNCMASQITNIALGLGMPWLISNIAGRCVRCAHFARVNGDSAAAASASAPGASSHRRRLSRPCPSVPPPSFVCLLAVSEARGRRPLAAASPYPAPSPPSRAPAFSLSLPRFPLSSSRRPVPVTSHHEIQNGAFIQLGNIVIVSSLLIGITVLRRQKKAQLTKWKAAILLACYPLCLAGYACFVFIPALQNV